MSDPFLDTTVCLQENSIEQLPIEAQSKLRSTQILTCIPQLISELLQNSLDAGASHVDIGVDCEEWSCWVRDDGIGISREGMDLLGSEGGRYVTSKAYTPDSLDNVDTFGFRGEALASAANLSCIEISSRTSRSRESWSVILKGGVNIYNGPSIRWRRESPGTVVCIRDAFYNLPVRRLSHPSPARTLEQIRREVAAYALVFPSVTFSLENTNATSENRRNILRVPKTISTLAAFRHLYGRALVENVETINECLDDMKLEGFLSLQGAHSKDFQFIYINRHPVANCSLHRIIDNQFSSSTFAKNAYDEIGENSLPYTHVRRSPRKTERRPVYVLNLTIPPRYVDNCLEPSKTSVHLQNNDTVSSFLVSTVRSFLIRHGFLSQEQLDRKRSRGNSESPCRKRKKSNTLSLDGPSQRPVSPTPIGQDMGEDDEEHLYIYNDDPGKVDDGELTWRDPTTGEYFIVDTRTGNSYPRDSRPLVYEKGNYMDGGVFHSSRRRTIPSEQKKGSLLPTAIPDWIQDALLENKAYSLTERKIPSLSLSSCRVTPSVQGQTCTSGSQHECCVDGTEPVDISRRFHRHDLLNAKIINQVDRKFIACLIDDSDDIACVGRSLVLIDQHAADERVRVERYLKDLCVGFLQTPNCVRTRELSPAVNVLLTRHEVLQLKSSEERQMAFRRWGFQFKDLSQIDLEEGVDTDTGNGYVQILVQSIPEIVSDKLLLGDELRELIKGFLAKLETDIFYALPPPDILEDEKDEFGWFKALRWCPRELIELVNSKACRGAVMFNDSLTMEQCELLVVQLTKTAFPFQCAHGRPCLVPLAKIDRSFERRNGSNNIEWNNLV